MENKELRNVIIEGLNKMNHLAWVALQAANLRKGFKVPEETNGPSFKGVAGNKMYIVDIIENLEESVISGLGLGYEAVIKDFKSINSPEEYEEFHNVLMDILETLEFEIKKPESEEELWESVLIVK